MAVFRDEKRGTWYCKFYYKDWKGQTKQGLKRGFAKKKDAQIYEANIRAKANAAPTITLEALAQSFLADYKVRRSANSYKLANTNLRYHILPVLGSMAIDDISPLTIRTWQNKLLQSGKANSTLRSINNTFRAVLTYAVNYYNLPVNPFTKVEPMGKTEVRQEFIEHSAWLKVFGKMVNLHDRAIFSLLYWSGMRLGEVQGLSVNDINFDTGTVNINKQYSSDQKELIPLKTKGSRRIITIPGFVMNLIKEYFDNLIEVPLYPFTLKTARGLNYKLKRYCEKANVSPVTVHALRHSHASLLIKEGVAINLIAERLGHTSPAVTLRVYSHVYENQDRELADTLNAIGTKYEKNNIVS